MRRFFPRLPLRAWLLVAYMAVLVLPVLALLVTGALGQDLVRQTRWDLEHQASLLATVVELEVGSEPLASRTDALSSRFRRAKRDTLTGIRLTDLGGRVIASSGSGASLGEDLSDTREVRRALAGWPGVEIRPREAVSRLDWASESRHANKRVFVAWPVRIDGELVGALVLSRTPREEFQALYQMAPAGLLWGALVAVLVTVLWGLLSSWILTASLRTMARGATRIADGDFGGVEVLAVPKTSRLGEVGVLAVAVETMAVRLRERLAYISEFASNVSHEFKTPLSTLKGTLELLGDEPDMPMEQRQRFMTNATRSVERLERLVSGLLSLARAEEGGAGEPFALQGLIDELAGSQGVPVEGRAGTVRGDRSQLGSVLRNLLENASVHGGECRVVAFVDGGRTGFCVQDDGPGISTANQAHVFDRFFTTNRTGGSSGLGLALVRAIVFTHGGEVGLTSEPGHTVFTVTLPRAE